MNRRKFLKSTLLTTILSSNISLANTESNSDKTVNSLANILCTSLRLKMEKLDITNLASGIGYYNVSYKSKNIPGRIGLYLCVGLGLGSAKTGFRYKYERIFTDIDWPDNLNVTEEQLKKILNVKLQETIENFINQ